MMPVKIVRPLDVGSGPVDCLPRGRRLLLAAAEATDEPRKVTPLRFVLVRGWPYGPGRQLVQAAASTAGVPLLLRSRQYDNAR